MEDPEKLIVEKKLERIENRKNDGVEYLVEGAAVGDEGMVPCILDSQSGDSMDVTIADGPFTGTSVTVDKRHVVALGDKFFEDATRKLFK